MYVRTALVSDASPLAELVTTLGYASTPAQLAERLAALGTERATIAVVAEHEQQVIGFATAHAVRAVHCDPPAALLTALIVATAARRQGAGRALVAHIEAWARSQGSARIAVTTGQQRDDAQAFYGRLGYVGTGIRLVKELGHAR